MEGQAVVDARRIAELKQAANRLSDLFIVDVDKYVAECETLYSGGKYTDAEYAIIIHLCDVYIAVKNGDMSRDEAVEKQHELLRGERVSTI